MLSAIRNHQRGDTIIEVLFAITVFSLVAVGGLSLMNQGTALAERSLEIGLVRQQMDAQADALRYLNRAYVADYGKNGDATTRWNDIVTNNSVETAQSFDSIANGSSCQLPTTAEKPFALDLSPNDAQFAFGPVTANSTLVLSPTNNTETYSKIAYNPADTNGAKAEGIWIQAVDNSSGNSGHEYYDFHIRACWQAPGQQAPITLGTIVRLYAPRG